MFACLDGKEHFVNMNQMNVIQSLVKTMAPAWIFSTAIGKHCIFSLYVLGMTDLHIQLFYFSAWQMECCYTKNLCHGYTASLHIHLKSADVINCRWKSKKKSINSKHLASNVIWNCILSKKIEDLFLSHMPCKLRRCYKSSGSGHSCTILDEEIISLLPPCGLK